MHWMFLPLKRYAQFDGRSRRKEYWMFFLGVFLLYIALIIAAVVFLGGALFSAFAGAEGGDSGAAGAGAMGAMLGGGIVGILILLTVLLLFIPSIAVGIRRLHDIDRTGWWLMLGYGPSILGTIFETAESASLALIFNSVSMIGFIVILVFSVMPGTRGPNRFGPDPKGENLGEVFA